MPTATDFLAAICAEPDNLDLRLVYADWLEEQGEVERAEFIRLQIDMDRHNRLSGGLFIETEEWEVAHQREHDLLNGVCSLGTEALPVVDGLTRSNCVGTIGCTGYGWYPREPPSDMDSGIEATFRRGFVETVRCRLVDWIGGPCPSCNDESGYRVHCERCESSGKAGRIGGYGKAIVLACPVTRVVVTDKTPATGTDGRFYFDFEIRGVPSSERQLPPDVYLAVAQVGRHFGLDLTNGEMSFPSEQAARDALSAALIDLARTAAGLPPLAPAAAPR